MTKSRSRKFADIMGGTFVSLIEDGTLDTSELTNSAGFITVSEVPVVDATAILEGNSSVTVVDNGSGGKVVVRVDGVDVSEFQDTHIVIPKGTTAERDPNAALGSLRYNTTSGFFETLTGSGWGALATPPSITSITPSNFNGEAGATFTVNGAFFDVDTTAVFKGSDGTEYAAATVTFVSSTQITLTNATNLPVANEPFRVSVTNGAGLSVESIQGIDAGSVPAFTTAAGTLATTTRWDDAVSVTVNATDAENTISGYAITEGNLPTGITLNGTTGAITGTSTAQATTTYTFTIGATDSAGNTNTRQFSIQIVNAAPVWNSPAEGSTQELTETQAGSITLDATDPEGEAVSYTSATLPAGLSISGNAISGTPTVEANTSVAVTASDGFSSTVRNFYINVLKLRNGLVWPNTVLGFANPDVYSYDRSGSNWVGYTAPYDGRFINEWDLLSDQDLTGGNGVSPSDISSALSRTVPAGTWNAVRQNADRFSVAQNAERSGFGLFAVGRDCPSNVTTIHVLAYGGGGQSGLANYVKTSFAVQDQDTFRVCVGGAAMQSSSDTNHPAANGVGGGGSDGDGGSDRGGGGGSGVWDVGISRNTSSTNRFAIAGGGANQNNTVGQPISSSAKGDTLYGTFYGLTPGNNASQNHYGGGPGAGGYSAGGDANNGNPGAYNTGTGEADRSQTPTSNVFLRGDGGGTGGNGGFPTNRPVGGAGGFAYNLIGLGGGGAQFGGGGGWQGGGGGWGSVSHAGSSFANNGSNTIIGASAGQNIANTSPNSFFSVGDSTHPYDYGSHGKVYIWW